MSDHNTSSLILHYCNALTCLDQLHFWSIPEEQQNHVEIETTSVTSSKLSLYWTYKSVSHLLAPLSILWTQDILPQTVWIWTTDAKQLFHPKAVAVGGDTEALQAWRIVFHGQKTQPMEISQLEVNIISGSKTGIAETSQTPHSY